MLKQFSWVAAGRIIAAILQMVSLAFVAAWAGPAGFGLLAAVLGVAVIPQTLLDFGLSTYVTKARAADRGDSSVTLALRFNNRTSVFLALIFGVGISILATFQPSFWMMLPLAIWIGSQRNADVWAGVALADGDAWINTVSLVGRRLLAVAVQVGFFVVGWNAVLGYSVGAAAGAAMAAIYVRRKIQGRLPPLPQSMRVRGLLRASWPYWLHSSTTQIRNVDTALVAVLASPVVAGMYAVASRLTGPLRILPLSLSAVLLPGLTRGGGKLSKRMVFGLLAVLGGLSLAYVSIAAAASWLVPTLLGDEYAAAVLPVQIVCVGLIFGAAASLLASVLQAREKQHATGYISTVTAIYCVMAIAVGVTAWGAAGAAIGLVSSFALQAVLMLGVLVGGRHHE